MNYDHIIAADGEVYINVDDVREALGIKEDENVFRAIEKLKEERDLKAADLELTNRLYKENRDFVDKVCEAVDIRRPYLESGYDNAVNLIAEIKRERDELKEKCDKLKKRANAAYGVSCGYSGDKAPAFRCDVISYSWEFGVIGSPYRNIRVDLELTPTANYKGIFDLEDLKKYIQDYGREKKLGTIESVDYQNAKTARAELAYLYKQVLGKERLDRNLSPHEVMKAILDEYKRVKDSRFAFSQSLQSVYMHIYEGTGYKVSDIYAAPDKIAEWIITRYDSTKTLGHMETVCNVNDFIDELCDKYNVVQPARSKTTRERIEYIFSALTDYRNMADSNFNKAVEFRKEKQAVEDSLAELRAKIREIYRSVVDDEWDEYLAYTYALNDINEEYKRIVHNFEERTADWSNMSLQEFRDDVCEIFDIPSNMADEQILKELHDIADRYDELEDFRADICGILDIEGMLGTPQQNDKYILERLEKLKVDGCDYTELRKAIWEAMDRKPETLPEKTARLVGEVRMLQMNYAGLKRMHDEVAKAIGMNYPVTDNDIINRVRTLYDANGSNHDVISDLNRQVIELRDKNADLESKFQFQSGLRQQWHARYEFEHERANGVQKCLDKTREALRVKDISLETAKKQYEKICGNLETVECALNGMKSKVRSLQEEKTKVISAIGQDIWDDAVK